MSAEVQNIIGGVEEIDSDFARIRVLSFEEDNITIKNQQKIDRRFPPKGYVVARLDRFERGLEHDDLIVFQGVYQYASSFPDTYQINLHKKYGHTGDPLLPAPNSIGPEEKYIDTTLLYDVIGGEDYSSFYIQSGHFIYGPFKSLRGVVTPKSSSSVCRFEMGLGQRYRVGKKYYLLSLPQNQQPAVDCSTSAQLLGWLKKKLASLEIPLPDMTSLKEALALPQLDMLDQIRFGRLIHTNTTLYLTRKEIQAMASSSERFRELYEKSIHEMKEEFQREFLDDSAAAVASLNREREVASQKLDTTKAKVARTEVQLGQLTANLSALKEDKDRLIKDIRAQLDITSSATQSGALLTYEDVRIIADCPSFPTLGVFVGLLNTRFSSLGIKDPLLAAKIIYQLKHKRAFISNSLALVKVIATSTNNCRIIVQQVEPDWIKFEYLYRNGLQRAWQQAHEQPEVIHFLVLEDINLSSIECYARPVLDLIEGVRRLLPGENTSWPANLWLIGIPFKKPESYEFGLPLIPETFKHWGIFPQLEDIDPGTTELQESEPREKLTVPLIFAHDKPFTPIPSAYF